MFLYMASPIFIEAFLSSSTFSLSCSDVISSSLTASLTELIAAWIASWSSCGTLALCSISCFSVVYTAESASLRVSTLALRSASAVANCSASCTMRSMSPSERPPDDWMRICCCLPEALSLAETLTIPLASMSKVTSICGMPRGAGGMPTRSNWPSILLSAAISRSPCRTLMPTCVWLSAAVEKVCDFFVGMVVLREMSLVITPPSVSMPSESGVTSSSRMSFTSPRSTPPWMAAPSATTSSGLTPLNGSLPNKLVTTDWTLGMRVMPPTRITSATSLVETPASRRQFLHGSMVRWMSESVSSSSLARDILMLRCLGPDASAVMKGRLISVEPVEESSVFAFSAASRRRCTASLSAVRSIDCSLLNSADR
mmetsp:Transcript_31801/g.78466  ORF Transcript_31801/g.78466 Transcript_31801/m.78466 type:complete len:370 (-) Transcript_31801:216-1325(-)